MNFRRMTSLLFMAAVAAVGVGAGIGPAAQAAPAAVNAVTPAPATSYEIFPPFFNALHPKCLDVPGSSKRAGQTLNVFHCKSSPNQLWQFFAVGNNTYQIQNVNSHLCLGTLNRGGTDGTRVVQDNCLGVASQLWQISSPVEPNNFNLINVAFPNECMATADLSGNDSTPVVIQACNPGNIFNQNVAQTWRLG